ncbi:MAG: NACHT domain-containing protein, partial [Cyanothece sp. SIO1E1]|nr:NACHT domain-containing protein [Cyanothece sp. SIO1E1]
DTSLQDAQVGQAGNDLIQNQGLINQLIKNLTINISGEQLFGGANQPTRPRAQVLLLDEVKSEVQGRLASSLHNTALINILKEEQTQQVKRIWDVEVKIGQQSSSQLDAETNVIDVFDQVQTAGKLLILGAPGAGKTTTMLELAAELITRAEQTISEPLPVLFSLSAWKNDRQTIAQWLVAELKSKYGVRETLGQEWLENHQLLPLLDGLDELEPRRHQSCIQSINQFQQDYRPEHLVVCCRRSDYENCQSKLQLNGAIYLHPLTEEKIHEYLIGAENPELWQSINADPALLVLARSPLLLSIMTLARQEISMQEWQNLDSVGERRQYLLNAYANRMLTREIHHQWYAPGQEPSSKQTQDWLVWLAGKLKENAQTEFLLENLQPSWLQNSRQQQLYRAGVGLMSGLILGLMGQFGYKFIEGLIAGIGEGLIQAPITGGISGLTTGPIYGLVWGLIGGLVLGFSNRLITGLMYGLVLGAIAGLTVSLLGIHSLDVELVNGLTPGITFGVISGIWKQGTIRPIETLKWSASKAKPGLIYGIIGGLLFVPPIALSEGIASGLVLISTVKFVLVSGLCFGLMGANLGGISQRIRPFSVIQSTTKKAFQGAVRGAIGGLLIGLVIGLSIGIIGRLVGWNQLDLPALVQSVIAFGISLGIVGAFIVGSIYGLIGAGIRIRSEWKIRANAPIWSKPRALSGLIVGTCFGLLYSLAGLGKSVVETAESEPYSLLLRLFGALFLGLFFALLGGLIGALSGGLRGPDIEQKNIPNQGIRQSVINAGIFAVVAGLFLGLPIGILNGLTGGPLYGFYYGLNWTLVGGLLGALVPGVACIQHVVLRMILFWKGCIPWNYARFLNYASERLLVKKIGGRYQFIHDSLRKHFSALRQASIS